MSTKRVLITGFGDFQKVTENPSWQAVKYMNRDDIEKTCDIHLDRRQIDVAYKSVESRVPKLWEKYQPDLTIHVGVKGGISCLNLETQARRKSYETEDIEDYKPEGDGEHFLDGPDTITTDLNVDQICEAFDNMELGLKVEKSDDAGKFVCEYIYYTSLVCCGGGGSKTIFVHVPNEGLGKEEIAQGLECILKLCLEQIRECNSEEEINN